MTPDQKSLSPTQAGMAKAQCSNWAGASVDILKQIFQSLPGWASGDLLRALKVPPYYLVCKHWVVPARSAVEHLAIEVTHQLQAVLGGYSGLCSLDLATYSPGLSAEGLASLVDFPHIRSLEVHADSISSLELVHTLTHLEELTIEYGTLLDEQKAPDFPSRNFSNLTSLTVDTEWEEPSDTFLYLSQLQALRHLSLCTAALNDFNFAALSLLTSLHMDNFQLENLEALQGLPQLMQLDLLGHPSDADIFMLANLTKLTALEVEMLNVAGAKCHLSSVVMLSSLVHLESLQCDLVDNGAQYGVYIVNDPADADTARMVVSIPDAPFCFALC